MTVKDEYLQFRDSKGLKTNRFNDRVILQKFLKDTFDELLVVHKEKGDSYCG